MINLQTLLQTSRDNLLKKEVHSLTARSLSREFRQELKGKENGTARSLSPEFKQEFKGKANGIESQCKYYTFFYNFVINCIVLFQLWSKIRMTLKNPKLFPMPGAEYNSLKV